MISVILQQAEMHAHTRLINDQHFPLYWADLQLVRGLRCYDNGTEREMSASAL